MTTHVIRLSCRYTVRCNRADIAVSVSWYNDIEPWALPGLTHATCYSDWCQRAGYVPTLYNVRGFTQTDSAITLYTRKLWHRRYFFNREVPSSSSSSLGSRCVPWLGEGLSMSSPNDPVLCCPLPYRVAPVFVQVVPYWLQSSITGSAFPGLLLILQKNSMLTDTKIFLSRMGAFRCIVTRHPSRVRNRIRWR